jgi:hypothetical protein
MNQFAHPSLELLRAREIHVNLNPDGTVILSANHYSISWC